MWQRRKHKSFAILTYFLKAFYSLIIVRFLFYKRIEKTWKHYRKAGCIPQIITFQKGFRSQINLSLILHSVSVNVNLKYAKKLYTIFIYRVTLQPNTCIQVGDSRLILHSLLFDSLQDISYHSYLSLPLSSMSISWFPEPIWKFHIIVWKNSLYLVYHVTNKKSDSLVWI